MKRFSVIALTLVLGVALMGFAAVAGAYTDVAVHIDIGNAPPPPVVVFHAQPHVIYVPEQQVYVVDDPRAGNCDYFRYEGYWYQFNAGYWYRCRDWRGPFTPVRANYVPVAVYRVPPGHWKHYAVYGPPGQAKKYAAMHDEREDDNDQGHGHGHGHGHGKHGDD
jgi:hypothetical protein